MEAGQPSEAEKSDIAFFITAIKAYDEAVDALAKRVQIKNTAICLAQNIILEADLKCISTTLPDTIAKRIISGSEQAARIVMDVKSVISPDGLIDGLRSATGRNDRIKEILLFYKGKFYRLPKKLNWSQRIFDILKSEKGYT